MGAQEQWCVTNIEQSEVGNAVMRGCVEHGVPRHACIVCAVELLEKHVAIVGIEATAYDLSSEVGRAPPWGGKRVFEPLVADARLRVRVRVRVRPRIDASPRCWLTRSSATA